MTEIRLSSGQAGVQLRDLSKRLRQAGAKDLRSQLRQRISEAGKPVLREVQDAVRELQIKSTHGGGRGQRRKFNVERAKATAKVTLERAQERAARRGSGLRETIARATKLQITAKGVRFVTQAGQLPEKQQTLPRHLDSSKGWRHPVFGNRQVWVDQKGGPWFAETIKQRAPQFRQAIVDAMDDVRIKLEGK